MPSWMADTTALQHGIRNQATCRALEIQQNQAVADGSGTSTAAAETCRPPQAGRRVICDCVTGDAALPAGCQHRLLPHQLINMVRPLSLPPACSWEVTEGTVGFALRQLRLRADPITHQYPCQ